jgi:hypothetical protein
MRQSQNQKGPPEIFKRDQSVRKGTAITSLGAPFWALDLEQMDPDVIALSANSLAISLVLACVST